MELFFLGNFLQFERKVQSGFTSRARRRPSRPIKLDKITFLKGSSVLRQFLFRNSVDDKTKV